MSAWLDKIIELIKKLIDKYNNTTNTTTTSSPISGEQSNNFTHPAKIVASLSFSSINKSGIYFSASKRNWGVVDGCDGEAHLYMIRNNKWVGGKFDHIRPSSTSRDWKNLNPSNPYGVFKKLGVPKSGEKIAVIAISYDHQERTNAIFAIYP